MNNAAGQEPQMPPFFNIENDDIETIDPSVEKEKQAAKIERENRTAERITKSKDFDHLYFILKDIGSISFKGGAVHSSEEVIDILERLRRGQADIQEVPRAYGLRDKATELLVEDDIYEAFVKSRKGTDIPL
jgi:hypothetical protein